MERIELVQGYSISRIIKGCWQMSCGHRQQNPSTHVAIEELEEAVASGITTFDCADIYSGVEKLLGDFRIKYSRSHGREALAKLQFHTKFVPDLDVLPQISKRYVEGIIDRSLRRLRMEALDLVQFHWWDWEIPGYLETAGYLAELQKAGKIRHIGVTNFDVPHLTELLDAGINVVSNQVQYSLIDRRAENGMTELCSSRDVHLLAYGILAGGFLSDEWWGVPEPTGELENRSLVKYKLMIDELGGWEVFQRLLWHLRKAGRYHWPRLEIAGVAACYVLQQPTIAAAIIGGTRARAYAYLFEQEEFFVSGGSLAPGLFAAGSRSRYSLGVLQRLWIWWALQGFRTITGDVYSLERKKGRHAAIMRYDLNKGARLSPPAFIP